MADFERRRRRHRHGTAADDPAVEPAVPQAAEAAPGVTAVTATVHDPEPEIPATPRPPAPGPPTPGPPTPGPRGPEPVPPHRPRRQTVGRGGGHPLDDRDTTDRGLRGLVGSGTSQVSTTAALRARDASRPGDAELAAAEESLTIVRRHWVPREDLPRR
ncbi:hypothetical protein [Micromonospora sp. LOL_023]|uniref:hypothetical protein n=1 Tax=Micromonospora sp. LOL_023 TaxID=3345418 RepID=UPI003A8C184F